MATKYNALSGKMDELDSFLLKNEDILDRLVFNKSWTWEGSAPNSVYVPTFSVDVYDTANEISEYGRQKSYEFFEEYAAAKQIGYHRTELFNLIGNLFKKNGVNIYSSAMAIEQGCYTYGFSGSNALANTVCNLIQSEFGLKTRSIKITEDPIYKGCRLIYIHSDQSVLDKLCLTRWIVDGTKTVKVSRKSLKKTSEDLRKTALSKLTAEEIKALGIEI